jgi:hypothetical protein
MIEKPIQFNAPMVIRDAIWKRVRRKIPEGTLLPWWAQVIQAILYPVKFIRLFVLKG